MISDRNFLQMSLPRTTETHTTDNGQQRMHHPFGGVFDQSVLAAGQQEQNEKEKDKRGKEATADAKEHGKSKSTEKKQPRYGGRWPRERGPVRDHDVRGGEHDREFVDLAVLHQLSAVVRCRCVRLISSC